MVIIIRPCPPFAILGDIIKLTHANGKKSLIALVKKTWVFVSIKYKRLRFSWEMLKRSCSILFGGDYFPLSECTLVERNVSLLLETEQHRDNCIILHVYCRPRKTLERTLERTLNFELWIQLIPKCSSLSNSCECGWSSIGEKSHPSWKDLEDIG